MRWRVRDLHISWCLSLRSALCELRADCYKLSFISIWWIDFDLCKKWEQQQQLNLLMLDIGHYTAEAVWELRTLYGLCVEHFQT